MFFILSGFIVWPTTLLGLPLVMCLEIMLQCLYSYFAHVIKEFTKLANIMARMENKILYNVKTRWILMLSLTKKHMVEYKNSFCEDGLGQPSKPTSYVEL